ncbi:uncharacterized protein [Haliotis asinina]|uniref:uncharacterized protein n=1 Tax=Haliotis asinina TaxID=109174 RepID=UPI00353198E6
MPRKDMYPGESLSVPHLGGDEVVPRTQMSSASLKNTAGMPHLHPVEVGASVPTPAAEAMDYYDWDLPPPVVPVHPTPVGGRLGIFWANWTFLEDPFVCKILRAGYKLPLAGAPPLTTTPLSRVYSIDQQVLILENINILLTKRAIEIVSEPHHSPGFYSPIFLVPKKGSTKMRMIHNTATFNSLYLAEPPHFRMTSLDQIRAKLSPGAWMASLDLQDAYLHVPIFPRHRKFLRFIFNGLLRKQLDFSTRLLQQLGWIINIEKSQLEPAQELTFIGGLFLTRLNLVRVPPDRWQKILAFTDRALSLPLTLREWQSLLGLLTSAQDLTLRGRLMLRPLQRFLLPFIRENDLQSSFLLPPHLHQYLRWWTVEWNVCAGVCLTSFNHDHELFVDASLLGWGAHLNGQTTSGLWSDAEREWHINNLEMQAVILAVRH